MAIRFTTNHPCQVYMCGECPWYTQARGRHKRLGWKGVCMALKDEPREASPSMPAVSDLGKK